ncbi:VOC family protein [Mucilaginibacter lacusdianchii]|uniref:VOC family protein n=1 Tax=Mucilaginibacter lacusdianchii TaxID=2684211 RepID=UPI00131E2DAD|nr:VOC family protein [Mucilaginibacter sp. JXJ CY 39]
MKKSIILLCALACCAAVLKAQSSQTGLGYIKLNHVALQVKDIPTSRSFYQNVVGLKLIPVPDSLKNTRAWFDAGNGQQIHLLNGRNFTVADDRNGSHFAMFVDDIKKAEAWLINQKIKYHKQVRFDGVVQIYFADPDEYLIELQQKR